MEYAAASSIGICSFYPICGAIGVTLRTLEVWEDLGIAREMIDAGPVASTGFARSFTDAPLTMRISPVPTCPVALGVPQYETERLLTHHLRRFGIAVERGVSLTVLSQDQQRAKVGLMSVGSGETEAAFRCVIGCDGVRSTVRHALGIGFEGEAYPMTFMLHDVHIAWDLPRGMALRALRLVEGGPPGMFIAIPLTEPNRYRVSTLALPELASTEGSDHGIRSETRGPDLEDIRAVADDLVPGKPHPSELRWSSPFGISMRLAQHYRQGRVFIAADGLLDGPSVASLYDREGTFAAAYGPPEMPFLIRPDGHIGWRGRFWRDPGLLAALTGFRRAS
jgi:2-polyprenyl-6-methoxyphenol hydroxylase-like FAD-dependent oxidoreductase